MSVARLERLEQRMRRRQKLRLIPYACLRDRSNPLEFYNSEDFKYKFHMFKETAIFIIDMVRPKLESPVRRGPCIPVGLQVMAVLRFYATGSFQHVCAEMHNINQSTLSKLIKKVSRAIAFHRRKFIKFPTEEIATIERENFYKLSNFPGNFFLPAHLLMKASRIVNCINSNG